MFGFDSPINVMYDNLASPHLMIHTKQLLLATCCDTTAGFEASFQIYRQKDGNIETHTDDGQTDMEFI